MSDFLAVAVVSGVFTIVGIIVMMYFWILKQEYRHKYLIKRYNLSKKDKAGVITPATVGQPGALQSLAQILPALQNIDLDQIGDLVDRFQGSGVEPGGEGLGEIGDLLKNPGIAGLLKGISGKPEAEQTEDPGLQDIVFDQ